MSVRCGLSVDLEAAVRHIAVGVPEGVRGAGRADRGGGRVLLQPADPLRQQGAAGPRPGYRGGRSALTSPHLTAIDIVFSITREVVRSLTSSISVRLYI